MVLHIQNAAVLRSGPLTPEQLADVWDEAPTRRAWWLELHSSAQLHAGTTISDLQVAVGRTVGSKTATDNGSTGQTAAAPVFVDMAQCLRSDHMHTPEKGCFELRPLEVRRAEVSSAFALMMPVCECRQPVASINPFDWQCAKCKGVIPPLADHLEAL